MSVPYKHRKLVAWKVATTWLKNFSYAVQMATAALNLKGRN